MPTITQKTCSTMKDGISGLSAPDLSTIPENHLTNLMIEDDISSLSTAYRPTIAEAELIKLRCIKRNSELEEINKLLEELTQRKEHLVRACATGSALLAPIRKLQPELLAEIFSHCIPAFSFSEEDNKYENFKTIGLYTRTSPHFVRKLLGRVCKWWKMVLDDTPRLWTTLTLLNVLDSLQNIEEDLKMSKNAPLDIYIHTAARRRHRGMHGPDTSDATEAAFMQLREAFPRIRNIDALVSGTHGGASSLFPSDSLTSAPALESLLITQEQVIIMTTKFPGVSIFAPKLHTLKLDSSGDLLTKFTDDTLGNLRCLSLNLEDLSLETYVPLFSHCSQLEHLSWIAFGIRDETGTSGVDIASLPSLKTLRFSSQVDGEPTHILKYLHTPNITTLQIDARMDDIEITETIVVLLQHGLEHLKHLYLQTVEIGAGFSALLPNLTGLSSLTLDDRSLCDDTLFDLLCPKDPDRPPACGSIEKLELGGSCFPMGSMISFIYRSLQPGRELHDKVYPVQVNYDEDNDPAMVHFATTHSDIITYRSRYGSASGHISPECFDSTDVPRGEVLSAPGWNSFNRHEVGGVVPGRDNDWDYGGNDFIGDNSWADTRFI